MKQKHLLKKPQKKIKIMNYSFIYEYDEYVFEVFYIYEKSTFGGDWMQPPDPDKIEYYEIRLVS